MPETETPISLYNTRTRSKAQFRPIDPGNVRMYVCGPTVYDRAHIGNARPVVVFDTLFRLLRHVYGDHAVTYVRNLTDIDDKIIARASESGRPIEAITAETTDWYHADMAALGVLPPTVEPRATAYVPAMVAMIETLIARRHAYHREGHVLFDVKSYPDYGRLARRSLDEMQAGARVEVAPYKRDPMDFVLWKPSTPDQPGWPSPWGEGRPGWHIECSAMSYKLLGESFDIHGGGIDLVFPHHENEIAQSMCAHPEGRFANVWMHNGFLNVEGEKMSKSLGNFFTVRDLLDRGIPGEVIRFVLLSTHYRQPIDWTEAKVEEATTILRSWRKLTDGIEAVTRPSSIVVRALSDDLNTPKAITALHELASNPEELAASANFMGLLTEELGGWPWKRRVVSESLVFSTRVGFDASEGADTLTSSAEIERQSEKVMNLLRLREKARATRDFARADAIREALTAAGVKVMDRAGALSEWEIGPDFDPAKLKGIDA